MFALQEQMMEIRAWKTIRALVECDQCRLCGSHRETVHQLPYGYKKLVVTEYTKRHSNTLKVLAIKWVVVNWLVPEDTKWYTTNCKSGKVLEKDGKEIFWDWKHLLTMDCIANRLGLKLKDTSKKTILLTDTAYPKEYSNVAKRGEKIRNYP